jgi:hypothetical protein
MKICFMEMDDRTRQSMALVIKHRANGAVVLTDAESADIAVFDLDHANALAGYHSLRQRRAGVQAIGLTSAAECAVEDMLLLRKPFSANGLLEAIQKITGVNLLSTKIVAAGAAASLSARIGSTRRRTESSVSPVRDQAGFDPGAYLLGSILGAAAEAEKRDMVAVIRFYGDRIILVDRRAGEIRTNLSSSQARAFSLTALEADGDLSATVGLGRPAVEYVTRAQAESQYAGKIYSVPQETFMWRLGAMTSRGRLPQDTAAEERVYLRRWPNLTRTGYSDNEMRIIAYWVRQAASPAEISRALDLSVQEVASVFTAAMAAGLAGKALREADGIWEAPEVTAPQERGLLSSILKRLLQRKPVAGEAMEAVAA